MADLRHAIRVLARRPAFAALAVLTLAVGIGASTAIFSVVNAVLLRPLPYADAGRVVRLYERTATSPRSRVSHPNFVDWRNQNTSFASVAGVSGGTSIVVGGREPVFADAYAVTDGFFSVMGVTPELGRTFTAEEMRVGGAPAVVVSRGFWRRALGGDANLPALRVVIEGMTARVVGVMPGSFNYPAGADVWGPAELAEDTTGRTAHNLIVVARLKAGVPVERAAAEMNAIAAQLKERYSTRNDAIAVTLEPLRDSLTRGWQEQLVFLIGAVTVVLLIACANVAMTMLARGEERRTELAVRTALGAAQGRLLRQLLAESVVVGLLGASGGLLLAAWLVRLSTSVNPAALPRFASASIDWRVLTFSIVLGLLTPLLFGALPALEASATAIRDPLAAAGRSGAAPVRGRIRSLLVAAEVALSLMLLVGAALLLRSFANVLAVDPGFDPRGAVTIHMAVPPTKYETPEQAAAFYRTLNERLRSVPGVARAGATNSLPLTDSDYGGAFTFEGNPDEGAVATNEYAGFKYSAGYRAVTPGYLEALGVPLKRGRFLDDTDRLGAAPAAVVNETFVRRFLPRTNPIGVQFKYAGMDRVNPVFTIVGVVGDIRTNSLVQDGIDPEAYVSLYQAPARARWALTMVVRASTAGAAGAVGVSAREALRALEPDAPAEVATFDRVRADSIAGRRFVLFVLSAFASIAVLLAAVGIYSVLSRSVAQRTPEIGIRMALGADAGSVVSLMLRGAMRAVGAGLAIGLIAGVFAMRVLKTFLFNVRPLDPIAFALAATVLTAVAALAAYVPARRATRVDPVAALRAE